MPRKCRNWRIAPLLILITVLIGGCVGDRAPYPDDFPPLAAAEPGKCPDVSEQYSNKPGGQLSNFLWYGEEDTSHDMADRVVVTQPDPRTIEFVAPLEGGRSMRRSLSRDDNGFSCSSGFVVISTPKDVYVPAAKGDPSFLAWTWKEMRFARTIKGSLAVEYVSKHFGLLIFLPVGGPESSWILIPAAPESAVKQPSPTP